MNISVASYLKIAEVFGCTPLNIKDLPTITFLSYVIITEKACYSISSDPQNCKSNSVEGKIKLNINSILFWGG